ncbi:MAG: ATP synthase F1 subunit gamma [Deltaproteobacteria bacterium]|nr:ATP synthase F1 subunit gamma [Deltaproteobacteria bacterium]
MATLKAIRKRIGSIRNTQQITKAMKMVSAAKLRRAQEAVVAARPYAEKMTALLQNLSSRIARKSHPLLMEREEKRQVDLLVLTADRGLCGGYNANLIRVAEKFIRERGPEKPTNLILVGRRGVDYFRRRRVEIADRYINVLGGPVQALAAEVAGKVIGRFVREETDEVYLLYSRFRSALSQVPTLEKLVPVVVTQEAGEGQPTEYLFEPDVETLLSSLLPKVVEVSIYRAFLEASASEYGARMTAMDSASTNAAEMISRLSLEMNRARQASITKELLEIVSTAEALK